MFLLISYIIEQYVVTSLHDHQDGAWVNSKELADNNRPIIGVASVEKYMYICFLYNVVILSTLPVLGILTQELDSVLSSKLPSRHNYSSYLGTLLCTT